jgi:hypothetical protein
MKTTVKIFFMIIFIAGTSLIAKSQPPAPPVLPDQHGNNGNYSTSAAPVGDGTEVMIILGLVYLIRKMKAGERRSGTGSEPGEL